MYNKERWRVAGSGGQLGYVNDARIGYVSRRSTPGRQKSANRSGADPIRPGPASWPTICAWQDYRFDHRVRDPAPLGERLASVAPIVICVSPNVRPIARVSQNSSGKDPSIALAGDYHLRAATTSPQDQLQATASEMVG